jgi:DNA mismatch repair protein MutS
VQRAQSILDELETTSHRTPGKGPKTKGTILQISLFGQKAPLLEEIEQLEIDSLTPLEALTKLYDLKKKAKESA